jgi:hypothetical protein
MTFTIDDFREMLRSARRELAMRRSCYPHWIAAQRLKVADASRETNAMEKIVLHLQQIVNSHGGEAQPVLPLAERDGA